MSYKVLARKWRPRHFEEVVGQEHVARTLINSIEQDRVAHAYLFCGARGVGKTSTARILAKALNCEQGPTARPCYECSSCEEIHEGQSVDVFEIDGASNRGINEIRELREGVRYAPSRDRKKVYIIDEVHMLTTEAFNALLKTLEEPPEHAQFIFATTEPQKIPVTILSRCQRFDFKRISQRDIVAHLEKLCEAEGLNAEKAALQIIARQANGGMRDALSLLDQIISFSGDQITEREIAEILGVANRKQLFEVSEAVVARNAERALMVLDDVNRYGYDLQQFASELVTHFRDLMVTAVVEQPEKVTQLTESELEVAREQVDGIDSELLHRYFSVMVEGAQKMSRSGYPKLIFEMTLVRLSELEPMKKLDLLVDRLHLLEETLEDDAGPVDWPDSTGGDGGGGSSQPVESEPERQQPDPEPEPAAEPESKQEPPGESAQGKNGARTTDEQQVRAAELKSEPESPSVQTTGSPGAGTVKQETSSDNGVSGPQMPPVDAYEASTKSKSDSTNGVDARQTTNGAEALAELAEPAVEPSAKEPPTGGLKPVEADEPDSDTVVPDIPEPLSPSEHDDIEVPDIEGVDEPQQRWETLVAFLRQISAPVAATCDHAYLKRFDDGVVSLRFEPEYIDFARDEKRRRILTDTVQLLFGDHWEVRIDLEDQADPTDGQTLDQKRLEDLRRRREEFKQTLRDSSPVQAAQRLFDADDPKLSVKLYDE